MKHIIFDLGGVLIELKGLESMLSMSNLTESEFWHKWLTTKTVKDFESGRLDAKKFSEQIVQEFTLGIESYLFLEQFKSWPSGFYEGVPEFLNNLRKKYKLSCLSNSNTLHWNEFVQNWNLKTYFDYTFASHEIGFVKPDKEIFVYVLNYLNLKPEDILYFDDNILNIEATKNLGINSILTKGFSEVQDYFLKYPI
jgi:putative hydrolase of the HAD superfamily